MTKNKAIEQALRVQLLVGQLSNTSTKRKIEKEMAVLIKILAK